MNHSHPFLFLADWRRTSVLQPILLQAFHAFRDGVLHSVVVDIWATGAFLPCEPVSSDLSHQTAAEMVAGKIPVKAPSWPTLILVGTLAGCLDHVYMHKCILLHPPIWYLCNLTGEPNKVLALTFHFIFQLMTLFLYLLSLMPPICFIELGQEHNSRWNFLDF